MRIHRNQKRTDKKNPQSARPFSEKAILNETCPSENDFHSQTHNAKEKILLLQKKKHYSDLIRQRNSQKSIKQKRIKNESQQCSTLQAMGTEPSILSKQLFTHRESTKNHPVVNPMLFQKTGLIKLCNSRDNLGAVNKISKQQWEEASECLQNALSKNRTRSRKDIQSSTLTTKEQPSMVQSHFLEISQINIEPEGWTDLRLVNPQLSYQQQAKGQLVLQSKVVEEGISSQSWRTGQLAQRLNQDDSGKEAELLRKHNNTFKKELTSFRKQNGQLCRKLKEAQNEVKQARAEVSDLISQRQDLKKQLEVYELQHMCTGSITPQLSVSSQQLNEILRQKQENIFNLRAENKNLEMKMHIMEKKHKDEKQAQRSKTNQELKKWKQKCTSLQYQLNHLRKQRLDQSLSMQISQDDI